MYPREYNGDIVKEWAGNSQWRALRADLARYKKWGYSGFGSEGFWALTLYRTQRAVNSARPKLVWLPFRVLLGFVKKLFTLITHINLDPAADIGPGMLIPHVGPIRIHGETKIGADCAIHHVVTIGADHRAGGATIGDHVMLGCHSCILGPVTIGECANIASGSLVVADVPAFATAIGVPARILPGQWRGSQSSRSRAERSDVTTGETDLRPATLSTPHLVPRPERLPFEATLNHSLANPNRPAFTCRLDGTRYRTLTWAQLARMAVQALNEASQILSHDSAVLIFSRRTPESIALMLAAIGMSRPFSFINPRWQWFQIRKILSATDSGFLFVDRLGAQTIEHSISVEDRSKFVFVNIEELFEKPETSSEHPDSMSGLETPSSGSLGCILFTSGSTGEPKGVGISTLDLAWRAQTEAGWYELRGSDVLLNLLPFSFDVGLNQILAAIYVGCETVLCETWIPNEILQVCSERSITGIPCVPSIWQDMLDQRRLFDTIDRHKDLRFITVSGGDMPSHYLSQLPSLAPGVGIFKTYGQTEAFRGASLRPDEFAIGRETVGRPFPGVSLTVVTENGAIAHRNEIGELVHSGLGVMMRYIGDEERTREKLRSLPASESSLAVFTGDKAFIDSSGLVHIVGRADQMLKISGNRIYPNEVRTAICSIPGVRDALVLGLDSPDRGKLLFAFVVASDEGIRVSLKRLMRGFMPNYMLPRYIEFIEEIPRTASGKPDGEFLRSKAESVVSRADHQQTVIEELPQPDGLAIAKRIEELVRERIDGSYAGHLRPLREVLDSVSFLDLITTIDTEMRIGIDVARLGSDALGSPSDLAAALLRSAAHN